MRKPVLSAREVLRLNKQCVECAFMPLDICAREK